MIVQYVIRRSQKPARSHHAVTGSHMPMKAQKNLCFSLVKRSDVLSE